MAVLRLPGAPVAGSDSLQSVHIAGRRIHFLMRGAGEPVVMIHGLGGSWTWWRNNIDVLAQHHQVYALELGRRERWLDSRGRVRPAEAADVLAGWLDRMDLARVHLIGHSMGGQMSIRLAATYPERVNRLVLVDATGLPFGAGLLSLTRRAIMPAPERTREFRRMVLVSNWRTNPFVVFQTARDMVRDDVSPLLPRIQAPTLIIWGGRDPMVPVANAYALQAGIPDARLLVIPHAGHNPMYYHAGTFNRVVLDFFGAERASQDDNGRRHGGGGAAGGHTD
jgi:pimeloyl-ACP methyl ester carboxylesterase